MQLTNLHDQIQKIFHFAGQRIINHPAMLISEIVYQGFPWLQGNNLSLFFLDITTVGDVLGDGRVGGGPANAFFF